MKKESYEWNVIVSQVQEVLDLAKLGKLTGEEMREYFQAF